MAADSTPLRHPGDLLRELVEASAGKVTQLSVDHGNWNVLLASDAQRQGAIALGFAVILLDHAAAYLGEEGPAWIRDIARRHHDAILAELGQLRPRT